VHFCFIVPLMYPVAVVLSVSNGVGGCGCPNYSNVVRRTALSYAFIKTAPMYASAAKDITCLRSVLMIKIAPFVSLLAVSVLLPM
jgi:accessory gene regulator protein AgrB